MSSTASQTIALPATGTWEIDNSHTTAGFVARHLVVAKVRGQFTDVKGTVHIADEPLDSWVEVQIDASSIDTGDEQRDGHLRSPDFLDVERFPFLRYRSTSVERNGGTDFKVRGELTMKDVTLPVDLDLEFLGAVTDPFGNDKAVYSARTEIDRDEFGMNWNQALETGGWLVGKKVTIELEVETNKA